MPVMGFTKFERFFRAAGGVDVDRDDIKRYLDFVNDALYDLLLIGQATAKANVRDVILPWDLPVTKGLQESVHAFERLEQEIELRPILESLAAQPPLDVTLADDTQAGLPLLFGGISVALARTFTLIDAELKAVHTAEWERTFSLFRLLILAGQARTTRMVDVPAAARGKRKEYPEVTFSATGGIQWQRSRSAAADGTPRSSTLPASSRTSTSGWAS